ncbi:hypothetical protein FDB52_12075 [Clostridium botulinum]|nr:hypothetical protein [Clostridium botulinum]NFN49270.1 hypothetical protein [Clostridium botulinum]
MKRLKILASLLVVASVVAINTKQANATDCWKPDNNGWWLQEGSSYAKNSWRLVNGQWYYFDSTGYMKTGWVQDNGKWYYLNSDGKMLSNTTINGYALGADGAWIQSQQGNGWAEALPQETPSDPNKVLSSGMTLRDAKHSIDNTIERFKAMGQSLEESMGFINEQCKGMGTTYEEISRLPELATKPQQSVSTQNNSSTEVKTQESKQDSEGVWEVPDGFYDNNDNREHDGCIGGIPGYDPETAERMARENQ